VSLLAGHLSAIDFINLSCASKAFQFVKSYVYEINYPVKLVQRKRKLAEMFPNAVSITIDQVGAFGYELFGCVPQHARKLSISKWSANGMYDNWLASEYLYINSLELVDLTCTQAFLESLSMRCPNLRKIILDNVQCIRGPMLMTILENCRLIEQFTLTKSYFFTSAANLLEGLPLRKFVATKCPYLKNLVSPDFRLSGSTLLLEEVNLSWTNISVSELQSMLHVAPGLKSLTAAGCQGLRGTLRVTNNKLLAKVDLFSCTALEEVVLRCPRLATLTLEGCTNLRAVKVSSEALEAISLLLLPKLEALNLRCPDLRDVFLFGSSIALRDCGDVSDTDFMCPEAPFVYMDSPGSRSMSFDDTFSPGSYSPATSGPNSRSTSLGSRDSVMNTSSDSRDMLETIDGAGARTRSLPELIESLLPSCPLLDKDRILFDCVYEE
jgi:hypothetical protein